MPLHFIGSSGEWKDKSWLCAWWSLRVGSCRGHTLFFFFLPPPSVFCVLFPSFTFSNRLRDFFFFVSIFLIHCNFITRSRFVCAVLFDWRTVAGKTGRDVHAVSYDFLVLRIRSARINAGGSWIGGWKDGITHRDLHVVSFGSSVSGYPWQTADLQDPWPVNTRGRLQGSQKAFLFCLRRPSRPTDTIKTCERLQDSQSPS